MAGMQQVYSEAETKKLIGDAAAANGDKFRIRVQRRKNSGGVEVVASFEEALAEHVAAPEKWLPDLAGGGSYVLHVMHDTTGLNTIGDGIPFNVENMPPHQINPDIVQSADWCGPRVLTWPKKMQQRLGSQFQGSSVTGIGYDIDPPGGSTPVGARVMDGSEGWNKAQMLEKQLQDLRRNTEVDAVRRDAAERIRATETVINSLRDEIRALRTESQRPHESTMETLAKALGPLVPIFQSMISGQNDLRIKMLEQQQLTAQATLAAAKENNDRFEKLLMHLSQRPPMDPAVTMFLEHLKTQADNPAKGMLTDVISAISGMSNAAMQVMTTAMDAGLGGDRGGTGEIVREVSGAVGSFFQMMTEAKQTERQQLAAGMQQQRLPARAQVVQPGQPAQQPQRPQPAIVLLDQMVKRHHDPTATANFFLDALGKDLDLRARFERDKNDIEPFFQRHWGQWAMQNVPLHGPYVTALRDAVLAGAQARGWNQETPAAPQAAAHVPPAAAPAPVRKNGHNGAPSAAAAFSGVGEDGQPIDPNDEGEEEQDEEEGEVDREQTD